VLHPEKRPQWLKDKREAGAAGESKHQRQEQAQSAFANVDLSCNLAF
jgi:hypothetical protein